MSWYGIALYSDDPLIVCRYGAENNPLYGQCETCESFDECDLPMKTIKILKAFVAEYGDDGTNEND